jgi:hypothetical protein
MTMRGAPRDGAWPADGTNARITIDEGACFMKACNVGSILAIALCAMAPAAADIVNVSAPWNSGEPNHEVNLYEIYNQITGETLTNEQLNESFRQLDLQMLDPSHPIFHNMLSVTFEAEYRYAWLIHTFGLYYYDQNSALQMLDLFTGIDTTGSLRDPVTGDALYSYTLNAADFLGPIGLFTLGQSPPGFTGEYTWFSEQHLNLYPGNPADPLDPFWPMSWMEDHIAIFTTPDPDLFIIAIEDLPFNHFRGDEDYNDLVLTMRISVIPEPTSMALLGLGIAGMVVRKFRRMLIPSWR